MNWYDNIEMDILPVVRLLRDNGYNTTCSCGHVMTVDVDLGKLDDAEALACLLIENGYPVFYIETMLMVPSDGFWIRRATAHIGKWIAECSLAD